MDKYFILATVGIFIIFWIGALLDLTSSTFKKTKWKLGWLLIILFFPLIGSILYFLLKSEFKSKEKRKFNPGFMPNSHLSEKYEKPDMP